MLLYFKEKTEDEVSFYRGGVSDYPGCGLSGVEQLVNLSLLMNLLVVFAKKTATFDFYGLAHASSPKKKFNSAHCAFTQSPEPRARYDVVALPGEQ